MRLSGTNTITTIGTLSGAVDIASGTTTFNIATDQVLASQITGAGSLVKTGVGVLTIQSDNSYSGGTTISAGTLQVGSGGATGTLGSGNVVNNGVLVINRAGNLTFDGAISGSGTLIKEGAGTLTLTAANPFSGSTGIRAGTIAITNASGLGTFNTELSGTSSRLLLDFDGTFAGNGLILSASSRATVAAATGRTVTLAGSLSFLDQSFTTFGSPTETGTIVLRPTFSQTFFSSGIQIAGGTLRVSDPFLLDGFGLPSIVGGVDLGATGGIVIDPVGTLDIAGISVSLNRVSGAGTILNSGRAAVLTLNVTEKFAGTFDTGANGITLRGAIAGEQGLIKRGAGALVLASPTQRRSRSIRTPPSFGCLTAARPNRA
ncbi:MAG: autotransporter-associated beta strand repeat-containing protein [Porphyrobacter sp.]|nr:autotransporter-associated beta strand repeat-containing protein [Porphyrobacter sp.]